MGKGSTKKSSKQKMANERLKRVQELTRGLEAAIDNNDTDKAQHFVKELTLQCVSCRLDVKLKDQSQVDKDKEFSLKVNIEDKESSGSSIMLKVRGSDTIRDLKNRMLIKHMFPVEVQYWIIGKRIPPDNETLEKCRIQTHGYTAFLYLITAKSAGIDKTEFMRKQELLKNPDYVQGAMAAVSPLDDRQTLARQTSKCTSGSSTPGLLSGPSPSVKTKKDQDTFFDNINMSKTGKSTKEKFQQQSFKPPPQVPVMEDYHELSINQLLAGAMAAPVIPVSMSQQRVAVMHPQEDDESLYGWACPVCTYVNQPTRPGCELCAADRPDDYEVPEGYVVTEDEKKRLDREALIENQTREVQKHGRRERQYDNSSERELDDLLQFHEAIQHTIHKMSTPTQPHTTQSVTPKMRQSVPQNLQYVSPIRHRQSPTEINFDDEPTST